MDRYEPLPGIAALPGWLWRRTSWGVRVAIAVSLVAVAVAAAVVIPAQRADRDRRAEADQRARAAAADLRAEAIQADQRPRRGRTAAADRTEVLAALQAAILADARRRVSEPITDIECERFPRADDALPPERDPSVRVGRYSCLAVTSRFEGGALGQPYRAQIDFETGRFAYCKITGSPELVRDPRLATPQACGG